MQYISKLIAPVLEGVDSSFEVTKEANTEYNHHIQKSLEDSIFTFHNSWYRVNLSGRNCAIYPCKSPLVVFGFGLETEVADVDGVFSIDSSIRYWWMGQSVNWGHYKFSGLKGGFNELHKGGILPTYVIAVGLGIIGWLITLVVYS